MLHECRFCGSRFGRPSTRNAHTRAVHGLNTSFACRVCGFWGANEAALSAHIRDNHTNTSVEGFIEHSVALGGATRTYRHALEDTETLEQVWANDPLFASIGELMRSQTAEQSVVNVAFLLYGTFTNETPSGETRHLNHVVLRSSRYRVSDMDTRDVTRALRSGFREIETRILQFNGAGSGWQLGAITRLDVQFTRATPAVNLVA